MKYRWAVRSRRMPSWLPMEKWYGSSPDTCHTVPGHHYTLRTLHIFCSLTAPTVCGVRGGGGVFEYECSGQRGLIFRFSSLVYCYLWHTCVPKEQRKGLLGKGAVTACKTCHQLYQTSHHPLWGHLRPGLKGARKRGHIIVAPQNSCQNVLESPGLPHPEWDNCRE